MEDAWILRMLRSYGQDRAKRFLKAELKRADVIYEKLARWLREYHCLNETKVSIANKLSRGRSQRRSCWQQ
jgi:hypothetical protein